MKEMKGKKEMRVVKEMNGMKRTLKILDFPILLLKILWLVPDPQTLE